MKNEQEKGSEAYTIGPAATIKGKLSFLLFLLLEQETIHFLFLPTDHSLKGTGSHSLFLAAAQLKKGMLQMK